MPCGKFDSAGNGACESEPSGICTPSELRQSITSTLRPAFPVRPICRPAHSDPDRCLTTMGQMPYGWMRQRWLSSVRGKVRLRTPAANRGKRKGVVAAYEVFRPVSANAPSGGRLELSAPTWPTAPL
jgi:hypothetical protein